MAPEGRRPPYVHGNWNLSDYCSVEVLYPLFPLFKEVQHFRLPYLGPILAGRSLDPFGTDLVRRDSCALNKLCPRWLFSKSFRYQKLTKELV